MVQGVGRSLLNVGDDQGAEGESEFGWSVSLSPRDVGELGQVVRFVEPAKNLRESQERDVVLFGRSRREVERT